MIQIQNMQPDADGKYPYTGFLDCAVKILNAEGALKFYTGFPVYCARISLRVVVLFFYLYFVFLTVTATAATINTAAPTTIIIIIIIIIINNLYLYIVHGR
jgi:hypothetical protein